ncbi:MAG TPA: AMP-binding protein [Burkholderiaceae bacterium]|nr:AMP-binding protein [Burkholderiaceae bacterium]
MVSLASSVDWWARTEPTRTALIYLDQRLSYADLRRRVVALTGLLAARGVRPGDVVALLMKNSAAFIELSLAVSRAGAVLLPINYRLSADEVGYIVGHAGAVLVFVDDELRASAGDFAAVMEVGAAAQADGSRLIAEAAQREVDSMRHAAGSEAVQLGSDDALSAADGKATPRSSRLRASDAPQWTVAVSAGEAAPSSTPDTLFRLMYTSGTTDRPKGVTHTYGNYAWKCLAHITALGLARDDRLLVVGPLYHVGAFDLPGLAVLLVGGCLAVMREFEPQAALELIERERLTGGWMAPVMLNRCLALPGRDRFDLTSFRWLIGGGERTPEERIREFTQLFTRARYIDAYGLTETCSGDTMMEAGREIDRIGSTGRALAHVQIAIRSDDGAWLPAGATGEICLRGPKVFRGYWRDEARTAAAFDGDWFRTGDVGHLDDEGFLYLTDRKKDMIISGGENIASSEVERVLYRLPQVAEAAVVGLPDDRWGERVVAVVVPRPGTTLTFDELRAHCTGLLGGFKIPKQLVLRDVLPRNPSGKVLKRVLRDELAERGCAAGPRT